MYIYSSNKWIYVSCNKKVYLGSTQGPFKKDITIIKVVSHMKYTDTSSLFMWRKLKKNGSRDPILKWEIAKICGKYQAHWPSG